MPPSSFRLYSVSGRQQWYLYAINEDMKKQIERKFQPIAIDSQIFGFMPLVSQTPHEFSNFILSERWHLRAFHALVNFTL